MSSDRIPGGQGDVTEDLSHIDDGASFADPETHFYLPSAPITEGWRGVHYGAPTGVVVCMACWRSDQNVDRIDHETWCPQRHVHSRYWRESHGGR